MNKPERNIMKFKSIIILIITFLCLPLIFVSCSKAQTIKSDKDSLIYGEYVFDYYQISGNEMVFKTLLKTIKSKRIYLTLLKDDIPVAITENSFAYNPTWSSFDIDFDANGEYSLENNMLKYTSVNYEDKSSKSSDEHNEQINILNVCFKKNSERNEELEKKYLKIFNDKYSGR